jgi:4'-phosphopantetheinyl transferase
LSCLLNDLENLNFSESWDILSKLNDKADKPMPLHKIEWTGRESGWALWHISESEDQLTQLASPDPGLGDITSQIKRLEYAAARALVRTIVENAKLPYLGMRKNESGKPFLIDHPHHISLSHSFPYVAVQIDRLVPVGIDIEQPKKKILTIAHRVFNREEMTDAGNDLVKNCIYWCAKEALYKIHGTKGLSFIQHLSVDSFKLALHGELTGKISFDKSNVVRLRYFVENDFVLVLRQAQEP